MPAVLLKYFVMLTQRPGGRADILLTLFSEATLKHTAQQL